MADKPKFEMSKYFVVSDMIEITKASYDDGKKDNRRTPLVKPTFYVWLQGSDRKLYLRDGDKYYCGDIGATQDYQALDQIYSFGFVSMPAPKAIFVHRGQQKKVDIVAKPTAKTKAA